jgi:hypothetical protein
MNVVAVLVPAAAEGPEPVWAIKGAVVGGYTLKDGKGRGLKKATMVTLASGEEIRFEERLSTREAMRLAEAFLAERRGARLAA